MNVFLSYSTLSQLLVHYSDGNEDNHRPLVPDLHYFFCRIYGSFLCNVCDRLLSNPVCPVGTGCEHYVCERCRGGKKDDSRLLRCKCNVEDCIYTNDESLSDLIKCFRELCEYTMGTGLYSKLLAGYATNNNNNNNNKDERFKTLSQDVIDIIKWITGKESINDTLHRKLKLIGDKLYSTGENVIDIIRRRRRYRQAINANNKVGNRVKWNDSNRRVNIIRLISKKPNDFLRNNDRLSNNIPSVSSATDKVNIVRLIGRRKPNSLLRYTDNRKINNRDLNSNKVNIIRLSSKDKDDKITPDIIPLSMKRSIDKKNGTSTNERSNINGPTTANKVTIIHRRRLNNAGKNIRNVTGNDNCVLRRRTLPNFSNGTASSPRIIRTIDTYPTAEMNNRRSVIANTVERNVIIAKDDTVDIEKTCTNQIESNSTCSSGTFENVSANKIYSIASTGGHRCNKLILKRKRPNEISSPNDKLSTCDNIISATNTTNNNNNDNDENLIFTKDSLAKTDNTRIENQITEDELNSVRNNDELISTSHVKNSNDMQLDQKNATESNDDTRLLEHSDIATRNDVKSTTVDHNDRVILSIDTVRNREDEGRLISVRNGADKNKISNKNVYTSDDNTNDPDFSSSQIDEHLENSPEENLVCSSGLKKNLPSILRGNINLDAMNDEDICAALNLTQKHDDKTNYRCVRKRNRITRAQELFRRKNKQIFTDKPLLHHQHRGKKEITVKYKRATRKIRRMYITKKRTPSDSDNAVTNCYESNSHNNDGVLIIKPDEDNNVPNRYVEKNRPDNEFPNDRNNSENSLIDDQDVSVDADEEYRHRIETVNLSNNNNNNNNSTNLADNRESYETDKKIIELINSENSNLTNLSNIDYSDSTNRNLPDDDDDDNLDADKASHPECQTELNGVISDVRNNFSVRIVNIYNRIQQRSTNEANSDACNLDAIPNSTIAYKETYDRKPDEINPSRSDLLPSPDGRNYYSNFNNRSISNYVNNDKSFNFLNNNNNNNNNLHVESSSRNNNKRNYDNMNSLKHGRLIMPVNGNPPSQSRPSIKKHLSRKLILNRNKPDVKYNLRATGVETTYEIDDKRNVIDEIYHDNNENVNNIDSLLERSKNLPTGYEYTDDNSSCTEFYYDDVSLGEMSPLKYYRKKSTSDNIGYNLRASSKSNDELRSYLENGGDDNNTLDRVDSNESLSLKDDHFKYGDDKIDDNDDERTSYRDSRFEYRTSDYNDSLLRVNNSFFKQSETDFRDEISSSATKYNLRVQKNADSGSITEEMLNIRRPNNSRYSLRDAQLKTPSIGVERLPKLTIFTTDNNSLSESDNKNIDTRLSPLKSKFSKTRRLSLAARDNSLPYSYAGDGIREMIPSYDFTISSEVRNTENANRKIVTKKGCRCGSYTVGARTCRGTRCPCFVSHKTCYNCKCKGCNNPYVLDDVIKERDKMTLAGVI